jgi:prefoldin subunit 5
VQHLNRNCSEEQQTHVNKIAESNIAAEIQRLKKRKRELENAQESLTGPEGEGQLHWTTQINAEYDRLDQELQAVCNQLAQFSFRKASSMSPSS